MSVALNTKHLSSFISEEEYAAIYPQVEAAHNQLEAKSGPGNDFLAGCICPVIMIRKSSPASRKPPQRSARIPMCWWWPALAAAIWAHALSSRPSRASSTTSWKMAPRSTSAATASATYLNNIISLCKGKRFSINVISKSGTTTETSLAFRVLRELLEKEMGVEEANKRIYATTDRAKGTLKQLADAQAGPPSWSPTTWAAATLC